MRADGGGVSTGAVFTFPSPQNPGSMEGTQTLNADSSILQHQPKDIESGPNKTSERFDSQVRPLPPPDHIQKSHLFRLSLLLETFSLLETLPPQPTPCLTPTSASLFPLQPGTRKFKVSPPVSPIPSLRVHPTSADAPPSWTPTSLHLCSALGLCRQS